MSAARVSRLETLLGRVVKNRHPLPARPAAPKPTERKASMHPPLPTHAVVSARPAPSPPEPVPPPRPIAIVPEAPPPLPVLAQPHIEEAAPVRATKPTPMEQAVVVELETLTPREPSSVDVEITLDDDGTELTVDGDTGEDDALFEDSSPTAPVEMRAPRPTPVIIPADEPEEEEEELVARPIELPPAKATQPVARTVSRHARTEPETFGELLDRTLALRPR